MNSEPEKSSTNTSNEPSFEECWRKVRAWARACWRDEPMTTEVQDLDNLFIELALLRSEISYLRRNNETLLEELMAKGST